jgi:hypothetical protein
MRTIARIAGLAMTIAAALGLVACQAGPRPVAGVCKAFPAAGAAAPADGPARVEDCLHRWAYTLAGSGDDAATVGEAVMAACSAPLARWNQQGLGTEAPQEDAPSLLTGQPTNPIAEHNNFARARALFYVVQARAGGCKPPPRREGASTTTSPEA